jgi:hypothetical protein
VKITIDTANDSHKHIKSAIEFLTTLIKETKEFSEETSRDNSFSSMFGDKETKLKHY